MTNSDRPYGRMLQVAVACGAFAASQALGQLATYPAPSPQRTNSELIGALTQAVKGLQLGAAAEITVGTNGPLVEWEVNFDPKAVARQVELDLNSDPGHDAQTWLTWYRAINGRLLEITRQECSRLGVELHIETDVSTEFIGGSGVGSEVYSGPSMFRGSRCMYLGRPPPGFDKDGQSPSSADSRSLQITVTIVPDRTEWRVRETITGSAIWTNTGAQRLAIRPIEFSEVDVRRIDGAKLERLDPKMFICHTFVGNLPPVVLQPGESHQAQFAIETDPLSIAGAVLLADGSYELFVHDLSDRLNIPTLCRAASVEVQTGPEQDLGPRIIHFDVGGGRLVVVRENGDFSAFDLETGRRVSSGHIADYVPTTRWTGEFALSNDGKCLALVRQPYRGPVATRIELFDLEESARQRSLPLPTNDVAWVEFMGLDSFSADGKSIYLQSRSSRWTVSASTGEVESKVANTDDQWLSPDGGWKIRRTSQGLEYASSAAPSVSTLIPDSTGRQIEVAQVGRCGVYLVDEDKETGSYFDFESQGECEFGASVEFVLPEFADGDMVAIAEREDGVMLDCAPISFWRLDPPQQVWRLDDLKPREIQFAQNPPRVICGLRDADWSVVSTLRTLFEVYDAQTGQLIKMVETAAR